MLTDEELLLLNRQGLIPGPDELEEEFSFRVAKAKEKITSGEWIPSSHWEWARLHLEELFDFSPQFLPAFYSNRSLALWQGAASWIEDGKLKAIQLREGLKKGSYFGYKRDEILAHEAVHAARAAFNEPQAEEFFAYLTSEKWWRRAFGPLIRRPYEVWVFFVLAIGTLLFPITNLFASGWLGMGVFRLLRLHHRMKRAAKTLGRMLQDPRRVRAVLLRLTDQEIGMFAEGEDVLAYAEMQVCLRWRLIRLAYFD